jgi:SET domain
MSEPIQHYPHPFSATDPSKHVILAVSSHRDRFSQQQEILRTIIMPATMTAAIIPPKPRRSRCRRLQQQQQRQRNPTPLSSFAVVLTLISCFCQIFSLLSSVDISVVVVRAVDGLSMPAYGANQRISTDKTTPRNIGNFEQWAESCGIQRDPSVELRINNGGNVKFSNADDDWCLTIGGGSGGAQQGQTVISIPSEMALSAARTSEEYGPYVGDCMTILQRYDLPDEVYGPFYLFLKLLVEYELGTDSPYYPWLNALPRKFNTAVAMDDFCLSCLPPYILGVCHQERHQSKAFTEAVQLFDYIADETKGDEQLLKWAYNIVMTRCFPSSDGYDVQIVPFADMINHGYPDNCAVVNNAQTTGTIDVVLTDDIRSGSSETELCFSYGPPTNPSALLAKYGFLDTLAPATFCKMVFNNPSQELVDVGYDPTKMLFYCSSGDIDPVVWDVLLFSRLERKREYDGFKNAFYEACMNGDENTKQQIHQQFLAETNKAMLLHIDHILAEVAELTVKMNAYDAAKHPRLPLLRQHHAMVTSTFQKVRSQLT